MKKAVFFLISLFGFCSIFAQYTVKGGQGQPLMAEKNGNLQVYLLNGLQDANISFTSDKDGAHQWYKYTTKATEATPISCQQTGRTSVITNIENGCGYFAGETNDPKTAYSWIIDYSLYVPKIYNCQIAEEEDRCENLKLIAYIDDATPLLYRTPLGTPMDLIRTFHLLYENLEWDEESTSFREVEKDLPQKGVPTDIIIDAPLKNTKFTLKGDDFAAHFGLEGSVTTNEYQAIALDVHAVITPLKEAADNEQQPAGSESNFSAPVEFRMEAYANEPVASMYIWEIIKVDPVTRDSTTIVRYTEKSLNYTFQEAGSYVIRLEVVDYQSVCFDNSHTTGVFIGESALQLPNAFSPGSSIEVNDEYRVSYKSIVKFKASIYNRWGNLLYQWDDPARGWDGKVEGKYVPTGVYFIVVDAKGADGKIYKESKDINVLRSKNN
ncbi:hypothetical protein AGMMS50262_20070 [Bacteroidia bacterium]|nr:hypothetical protein AGMMS50262_20070 [Bacteroidia bacterium]